MKTTKRISVLAFAIIAFAVTMTTVSCQSKQDKKSEQSNDSAFVFSTPKVLNVGDYINKHFEHGASYMKMVDTTGILSLSDIADDVEYVLLKTSNDKQEVFIGRGLYNVFISKDYIFVHMANNIIQYDRQGNLIRTIGRQGLGPGEYNWVYQMFVDDKTKRIFINTSGKINEYDFEGKFLRAIKTTYDDKVMPLDSNRIAVEVSNIWYDVKERLVILNEKGEVEKSFPRYQLFERTNNVVTDTETDKIPRLTRFHDTVYFNEAYNDTIFELKNNELQMRYFVDWGKYAMKPEYFYEQKKYDTKQWECLWQKKFYETDRYVFILTNRFGITLVYDKKNDHINAGYPLISEKDQCMPFVKILNNTPSGFKNDLDGGMIQNIDGISIDSKYIISYYYASDIKDFFEEVGYGADPKYPDKQAKLKALVDSIDENKHNLLIMMSKLKE